MPLKVSSNKLLHLFFIQLYNSFTLLVINSCLFRFLVHHPLVVPQDLQLMQKKGREVARVKTFHTIQYFMNVHNFIK